MKKILIVFAILLVALNGYSQEKDGVYRCYVAGEYLYDQLLGKNKKLSSSDIINTDATIKINKGEITIISDIDSFYFNGKAYLEKYVEYPSDGKAYNIEVRNPKRFMLIINNDMIQITFNYIEDINIYNNTIALYLKE